MEINDARHHSSSAHHWNIGTSIEAHSTQLNEAPERDFVRNAVSQRVKGTNISTSLASPSFHKTRNPFTSRLKRRSASHYDNIVRQMYGQYFQTTRCMEDYDRVWYKCNLYIYIYIYRRSINSQRSITADTIGALSDADNM